MGRVEVELGSLEYEYHSFYYVKGKGKTTPLFENLWYHKVVSGFFRSNRHCDCIEQFLDTEAIMDITRWKLGLPISMFCYIKHKHGYWQSSTGRLYKHQITKKLRRGVLEYYGYKCYYCGVKLTGEGSDTIIHHLIPEMLGGKTNVENLRPVCLSCHKSLGREYWKRTKPFITP